MQHIADSLKTYGKLFTCFCPERKHRDAKAVGAFAYKNLTKTMLSHDVRDLRINFSDPATFSALALVDAIELPGTEKMLQPCASIMAQCSAHAQ